jgi:hypothetical protein
LPSSPESGSIEVFTAAEADIRAFIDRHNKSQDLQMDQICGPNSGFGETLLPQSAADIMRRTLDSRD